MRMRPEYNTPLKNTLYFAVLKVKNWRKFAAALHTARLLSIFLQQHFVRHSMQYNIQFMQKTGLLTVEAKAATAATVPMSLHLSVVVGGRAISQLHVQHVSLEEARCGQRQSKVRKWTKRKEDMTLCCSDNQCTVMTLQKQELYIEAEGLLYGVSQNGHT